MTQQILIVDDEARYRQLYSQTLESAGFATVCASCAAEAMAAIEKDVPSLVISDVRMPGADGIELLQMVRQKYPQLPFLLVTAYADVRNAVTALKLGAVDYLTKPVDLDELLAAARDSIGTQGAAAQGQIPPEAMAGVIAESPLMKSVFWDAYRIAASDASVLLVGESGSGKEVVAQFIHSNSPRRNKPMVALNCAAIPHTLLASELFGHEKGAFTGAVEKRLGRFREADGGTLLLDEIGDMPLELQASLLRAIETGKINPVGSDKEIAVDYRLLAATNHDLQAESEAGKFRRDLYYRLNVITIEIPPLRERSEDIIPLARRFLSKDQQSPRLSRAATRALCAYRWPGNVRELSNAMEHARLLCQTDVVLPEHLPPAICRAAASFISESPAAAPTDEQKLQTLEENEIRVVRRALAETNGNRTRAAEILGITRRGLIYKLKKLGIN